ncbi:MAG: DNA starvation/stationary phase protection protein [Acidobacteriota bacterium]|nr:DNA starvation/stationary phase protection protein [Acidobacteriota bacterium]
MRPGKNNDYLLRQFTRISKFALFGGLMMLALASWTFAQKDDKQKQNNADRQNQQEIKKRADQTQKLGTSNEKLLQPKRIEDVYPLTSDEDRAKSVKILQQVTVDLLSLFNQYKEAHWNVNGALYLPLHDLYQEEADYYRGQADIFAERALQLGFSVDGRYSTIAKTTAIPDFPGGYVTDNESLKLLLDRVGVFQKEVYQDIRDTEDTDAPTSNKLQDLAYGVDKSLWKLRIHVQKPGGTGEDLPFANQEGRDRTKP